jgi:tRNA (cytidine/uridine-2'-O-)-methyltransferase
MAAVFEVILYRPVIPPNTGNVIRLCANTGCRLHLIEPLGFDLEERQLRRAGLDYADLAEVRVHRDLPACLETLQGAKVYAVETAGSRPYSAAQFQRGDALLFGQETQGLPPEVLQGLSAENILCIPMRPRNRSLNLANAVALVVYEAWRQQGFA